MKCAVKDCTNHAHQGKFIGLLCAPCHAFIAGERSGGWSQAYRNARHEIDEAVKAERGACAKVCEEQIKSYMSKQYTTDPLGGFRERFAAGQCAAAIRARGEV